MSVGAHYLLPLALLFVPEIGAIAQARPAANRVRTIVDSLAHAYLDARRSPGLSIEVVRGRDTLVRAGYGFADLEQRVAASPSDRKSTRLNSSHDQISYAGSCLK